VSRALRPRRDPAALTGTIVDGAANDFVFDAASNDKVRYESSESSADGQRLILVAT
jgi:hypothetical protein